jgi:hypothetical protein
MSVAGISSTGALAQSGFISTLQQRRNDFQQLAQALQSGDLSGAQAAFSDLTSLNQNRGVQSANSTISNDFSAIGQALQSGDLAGAQQAFATLQQDVQSAFQQSGGSAQSSQQVTQQAQQSQAAHHHRHHHVGNPSQNSASDATGDSLTVTGGEGDQVVINLGTNNGATSGPEQVTLNFNGNSGGPEQVTLNLSGNETVTLNFGAGSTSSAATQTTGGQVNLTA